MNVSSNYRLIWDTILLIPRGKVATYGDIARLSGLIGQARQVGYALRNTPPGLALPWHRVINSAGRISLPKANGQYRKQKKLLEKEGVIFKKERIDLRRFGWIRSMKTRAHR